MDGKMRTGGKLLGVSVADLLQVHSSQNDAINNLWAIYVVVVFGVLGFVYRGGVEGQGWRELLVLTVLFSIFAFSNSWAISRPQGIVVVATDCLHREAAAMNAAASSLLYAYQSKSVLEIRIAHAFFSFLVLIFMWLSLLID